ncbi:PAAR domain-containing protein [Pseudoalteromonas obscura]|uniref:PAAR domain-containing protein n=1 Tax=Pseudoalteromonas obscura TaxID=3048491 RepID=A0ABT7EHY9_9GAMM|nr:PAAR domain-containing protein [Pseudoalteromonas sp. P94(2023)]MDK2594634.1 PAAR domain-containing protein [Pseudoalteromonas sp. P94(2023)]
MPAISVDGAMTDVHGGYAPGTISASGPKFTVGGVDVLREGDSISDHVLISDPKVKHSGMVVQAGAPNFTIGGKAVARLGDPTNCGGKIAIGVGSFTVGDN